MNFRFRIVSFNIRHYWADDGDNSWERRSASIRAVLRTYPAEIICFQEVNLPVFDFLSQALPGYDPASDREDRGPRWEYRPVYVKPPFRITGQETISLSQTPDVPSKSWGSNFVRQATRVVLDRDGRELAIYNTHLDFDEQVQLNQAKVVWDSILAKDPDRPVILAGDFNSTEKQEAYSFLTREGAKGGPAGDFRDAMPGFRPETYHGFGEGRGKGCLDWILYRGRGLRLSRPARTLEDRPGGRFPSDHFPVMAVFELTDPERKP